MRSAFAPIALAALAAANPVPQGVTENIEPPTSAPAGCSPDYSGRFQIQVVNVSSTSTKRSNEKRQAGALYLTLAGGVLKDQDGRTGYIAANNQFQFDAPAQTGAIYTAGWSVCQNNSLAIGSDVIFKQCLSGTFYNLYDENDAAQCSDVYIEAINGGANTAQRPDGQPNAVSQIPDGQVTGSPNAPVTQIGDGQIQNPTGNPVTQIGDGQIQGPTGTPVQQIPDGQLQAISSTIAPVTQLPDGQVNAPTGSPVTQIADGQPQAPQQPTGTPVQQIPDGQPQAVTSAPVAPVTQIADGQIQAPTSTPTGSPVTQIGDGQVQAPTGSPVTQISDGQIQAPTNGSVVSPTPVPYTGAAAMPTAQLFGLAAGALAVAMI